MSESLCGLPATSQSKILHVKKSKIPKEYIPVDRIQAHENKSEPSPYFTHIWNKVPSSL